MKATVSAHLDHGVKSQNTAFVHGPDDLKGGPSLLYEQLPLSQLLSVQYIGFWKMKNVDF